MLCSVKGPATASCAILRQGSFSAMSGYGFSTSEGIPPYSNPLGISSYLLPGAKPLFHSEATGPTWVAGASANSSQATASVLPPMFFKHASVKRYDFHDLCKSYYQSKIESTTDFPVDLPFRYPEAWALQDKVRTVEIASIVQSCIDHSTSHGYRLSRASRPSRHASQVH